MFDYMNALVGMYLPQAEETEGQGMVEYALILALVSVVAIAILGFLGGEIVTVFTSARDALTGAGGTS